MVAAKDIKTKKSTYRVARCFNIVAIIFAFLFLLSTITDWKNLPSTNKFDLLDSYWWINVAPGFLIAPFFLPLIFSVTAIVTSRGRPEGRLGYAPLVLCAVIFILRIVGMFT